MSDKYDKLVIDYIDHPTPESHPDFALRIGWSHPRIGFGTVDFFWKGTELHANTEHMGRDFLKYLLGNIADEVVIDE